MRACLWLGVITTIIEDELWQLDREFVARGCRDGVISDYLIVAMHATTRTKGFVTTALQSLKNRVILICKAMAWTRACFSEIGDNW